MSETIYAHSEGYTLLKFSPDGKKLYTGGGDSAVRSFNTQVEDRGENIQTLEHHNDAITSLIVTEKFIVTGSEDRSVVKFSTDPMHFQATLTRCTLPVRHLALQPQPKGATSEQFLAVASDELNIKLVGLESNHCHYLTGLRHPPASLSFHPGGNLLVAISSQGTILSWDLTQLQSDQAIIPQRTLERLGPISRPDLNEGAHLTYHPLGKLVALPSRTEGEVQLLRSNNLSLASTLKSEHTQAILHCTWSANGQFLAGATKEGHVTVWRVEDGVQCQSFKHDGSISGIEWSPTQNILAITDENGSLIFKDHFLSASHGFRQSTWGPATYSFAHKLDEMFQEEEDGLDMEEGPGVKPDVRATSPAPSDLLGSDMSDSIGGDVEILSEPDFHALPRGRAEPVAVDLQPSFQPGSTLVPGSERQFLAYNTVGYIVLILGLDDVIYNVVFHNKDELKDYTFSDSRLFTQASLDERGAVFAIHSQTSAEKQPDQGYSDMGWSSTQSRGTPAIIAYRPHGVWGTVSSWESTLPPGEDIQVVVATPHGPAVTTTRGFLRIFSSTGIQKGIVMCPSPTQLTMASDHDEHLLLIHHHSGELGQLRAGYALFNLTSLSWVGGGSVTIPPHVSLEWAGFSSEGSPALMDSRGVVQILLHPHQPARAMWHPVLRLNPEMHFPYGISAGKMYCLQVGPDHPDWLIHPRAELVPWRIPVVSSPHSDSPTESQLLVSWMVRDLTTSSPTDSHDIEDRLLLKLIRQACQSDQPRRVIELATLLHTLPAQQQALQLADPHPTLVNRLRDVLHL